MARRNNQICVLFTTQPSGTSYMPKTYSWINEKQGLEYIEKGYGDEFDPETKTSEELPEVQPETDIPKDFPGRNHLLDAGIKWMKDVREIKDYDEIPGIGQSTETKITNYLTNGDTN